MPLLHNLLYEMDILKGYSWGIIYSFYSIIGERAKRARHYQLN